MKSLFNTFLCSKIFLLKKLFEQIFLSLHNIYMYKELNIFKNSKQFIG